MYNQIWLLLTAIIYWALADEVSSPQLSQSVEVDLLQSMGDSHVIVTIETPSNDPKTLISIPSIGTLTAELISSSDGELVVPKESIHPQSGFTEISRTIEMSGSLPDSPTEGGGSISKYSSTSASQVSSKSTSFNCIDESPQISSSVLDNGKTHPEKTHPNKIKHTKEDNQTPSPVPIEGTVRNKSVDLLDSSAEAAGELNETHFLSFEEWKKVKGATNDSPYDHQQLLANRPHEAVIDNSIGEEMEIDFSNFFSSSSEEPEGRIYKDKFNYASFDCAATIVKTNSEAKGATSILFENKDSYLLNPCSARNKFVIIELCQDILVDSFVIANFEFFSSTFKKLQISVSESFPGSDWKVLGQFHSKDIRDYQTFNITNPMIWAKFLRLEILEHYGNEYYCPLSLLRVHGRTMMQEYKQEELKAKQIQKQEQENVVKNQQDQDIKQAIDNSILEEQYNQQKEQNCDNDFENPITKDICIENLNSSTDISAALKEFKFDECSVTLPQLKFEQVLQDYNKNQKCDPVSILRSSTLPSSTPQSAGTQESIYKNIMKRLATLESNATLSILYIEEQSKLLSNAFQSLEKKHSVKLENLLLGFNSTVTSEIESFKEILIYFKRQTRDLFQQQQLEHQHMLSSSLLRLENLESDLKLQKIFGFINGFLLFCILLYIVITRDISLDVIEESKVFRVLSREQGVLGSTLNNSSNESLAKLSTSTANISTVANDSIEADNKSSISNNNYYENIIETPLTPRDTDDDYDEIEYDE
ncbi:hypothetical protein WICMUC_002736 [Wickerhamomyces mucosus]|uniref:SUN-like protein 1 n=1 Tax=Wickerhamomyces mucosus TaxID=1378264 RepID=A0A9P8PPU7_9ASCO|nr:hypothetical protein WICMUC_002736 [Wickerhamomyces mucosus]